MAYPPTPPSAGPFGTCSAYAERTTCRKDSARCPLRGPCRSPGWCRRSASPNCPREWRTRRSTRTGARPWPTSRGRPAVASRERTEQPRATGPQRLASLIKRVQDLMRTDPGLNGSFDRLSQLSWMLFLKVFDDHEEARRLEDRDYRPLLREPHRWRNWAADEHLTGEPLTEFIDGD